MVLALTIRCLQDQLLANTTTTRSFSIWSEALAIASEALVASGQQRVLFAVCDDASVVAAGIPSGAFWLATQPESFLYQIALLPAMWPDCATQCYTVQTMSTDDPKLVLRASPDCFVLPLQQTEHSLARCLPGGAAFVLLGSFLSSQMPVGPTLLSALVDRSAELSVYTDWFLSHGFKLMLDGPGLFTLFAPTNAAIASYATALGTTPEALLAGRGASSLMFYHVGAGRFVPPVQCCPGVPTLIGTEAASGFSVAVQTRDQPPVIHFNESLCTDSQLVSNGYLYVLDAVMSHGASGPSTCIVARCRHC